MAFIIALSLQGVWSALITVNLATSPEIPWSVPVIVPLVWFAWQYLGGKWVPRRTAEVRHRYLRARAMPARVFAWALLAGALSIVALAGCWIVMTRFVRMPGNVLPDMSQYPWLTTALMVVTGSLIGPVMEQAGFWGYGQVMLEEEFRPPVAILILSVLFAVGPPPRGFALVAEVGLLLSNQYHVRYDGPRHQFDFARSRGSYHRRPDLLHARVAT